MFKILIFLALLTSCQRTDRWTLNSIKTGSSQYDSSMLSYVAEDRVNGIDLEMLWAEEKLRIYLVVHSQPIASYENDPKKSLVKLTTGEKKRVILATRREGGQRLLLPESSHPFIIEALQQGESLTLQLPGYETKIPPGKFKKYFYELEHPSPFDVRINLPI